MISAKEAYDISFVNDECKEYLYSIEQDIVKAAKAGRYDVSIELAARGLAVSEDDNRTITMAIIGYLRSLGYNATISRIERHASLLVSWVKPLDEVRILGVDLSKGESK